MSGLGVRLVNRTVTAIDLVRTSTVVCLKLVVTAENSRTAVHDTWPSHGLGAGAGGGVWAMATGTRAESARAQSTEVRAAERAVDTASFLSDGLRTKSAKMLSTRPIFRTPIWRSASPTRQI